MKKQLQPQNLDIEVTKITNKTVTYNLTGNGQEEKWIIPEGSTFNKDALELGVRYQVISRVVRVKTYDRIARKWGKAERYDWVTATPLPPKAKLVARTGQQRKRSEAAVSMPLADDSLFTW